VKFEARIKELVENLPDLAVLVEPSERSVSIPLRTIEKLRYFSSCVQLSSNDSYGSFLRLLRSEPVPRHDRV
jgi:hypothetical protein